jgi:hypothetical protein
MQAVKATFLRPPPIKHDASLLYYLALTERHKLTSMV